MANPWKYLIKYLIAATVVSSTVVTYAGIVVIGNNGLGFNHLSRNEIKLIFLKQPVSLNINTPLQAYDQPSESPIYAEFYQTILNWSAVQINNYWNSNIFNGQSSPPPKLDDDSAVIAAVSGTQGAISYINSASVTTALGHVKILYAYPALPTSLFQEKKKINKVALPSPSKSTPVTKAEIKVEHAFPKKEMSKNITSSSKPKVQIVSNLWGNISNEFTLQADANKPMVRTAIEKYLQHHDQLTQSLANAAPYLFYVSELAKTKQFPMEVSLMPLILSNYNPQASGENQRAGLWQIKASDAPNLSLQINWWYDDRKNTISATTAVFNELTSSQNIYGDWRLTFAAYVEGDSAVQQALEEQKNQNKPLDFWNLNLKLETKQFVANICALAQVIKYASYYGLAMPAIEGKPYFKEVLVQGQKTEDQLSQLSNTDSATIEALNPGLLQWATNPNGNYTLLLPAKKAEQLNHAAIKPQQVVWQYHLVRRQQTLQTIANLYHTTVETLQKINHDIQSVQVGQGILVPVAKNTFYSSGTTNIGQVQNENTPSAEATPSLQAILHKVAASKGF